jgi:predicted RNase H-like HicB family nuclease
MSVQFILSEYIERALARAEYDKLEDGTFAGRIAVCPGVVSFAATLRECEAELRSTLEDWLWLGLKLGRTLPVIDDIDLNTESVEDFMLTRALNEGVNSGTVNRAEVFEVLEGEY